MPLTVTLAACPAEADEGRRIEELVFGEVFGNTRQQLAAEYARYEDASQFLVCRRDDDGSAVGVARLIRPSDAGLKTLVDVAGSPWGVDADAAVRAAGLDLDQTWDVATLAVLPHGRRGAVSAALYHALLATMVDAGALWWTAIVDCKVLTLLRRSGVPAEPLPGTQPAPYLGSAASVPVFGHLADIRLRSAAPSRAAQRSRAA